IPVDFQSFRLTTGATVFVDFKSIPYADVEVIEWHRRMKACEACYDLADWEGLRDRLAEARISHVGASKDRPLSASFFETAYEDNVYVLYRVAGRDPKK